MSRTTVDRTTALPGDRASLRGGRVAEQYRTLRAEIESAGPRRATTDDRTRSLVVQVAGIESGVADIGIRLAVAFADGGQSTLLIDADPRATGRHRLLRPGGASPPGLAEWLRGERPGESIPAYPSDLAGMQILPAGQSGPEGEDPFSGDRLPDLVKAVRRAFERTVVIAAPIGQAADALFIAPHVDGVVLVVAPGRTHGPAAVRARDALLATGTRIYGVVFGEAEGR